MSKSVVFAGLLIVLVVLGIFVGAMINKVTDIKEERVCGHRWCFRESTYDYRCHRHQDDE